MSVFVRALVAGVFAGLVVVAVSYAIERWGGTIGGVLGTSPSTIVAAAVGFAWGGGDELNEALFVTPLGMLLSINFLFMWRTVPTIGCIGRLAFKWKLTVLLVLCVLAWLVGATLVEFCIVALLADAVVPIEALGVGCTILMALFGVAIVVLRPLPDPSAKKKVSKFTYFLRSLCAAISIFVSVCLASLSPTLAGIASTFPAIFLTTMLSLTISHGFELSDGSTGPMMLGALSVPVFAMFFAVVFHALVDIVSPVVRIVLTTLIAYAIAVVGISIPVFLFLRTLKRRRAATQFQQLETANEESDSAVKLTEENFEN